MTTTKTVILTAGIHGDEPEGLMLAQQIRAICEAEKAPFRVVFHGMLNPAGFALGTRKDATGSDRNREWTTEGHRAPECAAAWNSITSALAEGDENSVVVVDCHSMDGTAGVYFAGPMGEALARGCFRSVARVEQWTTEGTLTAACEAKGIPAVAVEVSKGEAPGSIAKAVYRALAVWHAYGRKGK